MNVKITYFLDVTSSWCLWAEPAWAELKRRYAGRVQFDWQIALLDSAALPLSRAQADWFYRRSGTITASPFMLHSGWIEAGLKEYLAANCVALAARDLGAEGDRVRLALANAGVREGRKIGQWTECVAIAAAASGLTEQALRQKAQSPEIERRARETTAEFQGLRVTQRPTFVCESNIGDRAVLSGFWRLEPIVAALDSMLTDASAYATWKAHFGDPPQQ
ncbi:MAG: DsbA family protein [Verrucomicrobiota bacterium]